MSRVTIGIPAYKAGHLGQAIASVLAQTFSDFELLISDDCPDGSVRRVVEQFGDPRIRVIEGPRRGLIPNSVHIWENAACDLLKFVYDDDFLLPFGLADLVELMGDPQLTYAFCGRYIVDVEGRILHAQQPIAGDKPVQFPAHVTAEAILGGVINPIGEPSNILIRRSAFPDASCLTQVGGVAVRHNIDVAFYLNAARRGPSAGTPRFGAAFRRHVNQATGLHQAPTFPYASMEWELFIRAGVSLGLVAPDVALRSFDRLQIAYEGLGANLPELLPLAAGLPELRARLKRGERDLLDAPFLQRVADVEAAVAARERAFAAAGEPR